MKWVGSGDMELCGIGYQQAIVSNQCMRPRSICGNEFEQLISLLLITV